MKVLAYVDSHHAGLVPCVALEYDDVNQSVPGIRVRITATRAGYTRGDIQWWTPSRVIPRDRVRKFRSPPFPKILPYDWSVIAQCNTPS